MSRRAMVPAKDVPNETPTERLRRYRHTGQQAAGVSMLHAEPAAAAFGKWLISKGTSVEAWTAHCAEHGRPPTLTVSLALGYISDRLDGTIKPDSVAQRLSVTAAGLARNGWDVSTFRAERAKGQSALVTIFKAARAGQHIDDVSRAKVRARPLTTAVITKMLDQLTQRREAGDVSEIWATWMRALVLCGFAAALRINEIARLEWSWCTFEPAGLIIDIPHSKRAAAPKRVLIPRGSVLCPVHALEELRLAYAARSLDIAHVFALPDGRRNQADAPWVDLIESNLAAETFHSGKDPAIREAAAIRAARCRIARHLDWLLEASGVEARSVFERPSSHGLRRGCATELANAGVSLLDIAKHLRHASPTVTSIYIEGADLHVIDPARPTQQWRNEDERSLREALAGVGLRLGRSGV